MVEGTQNKTGKTFFHNESLILYLNSMMIHDYYIHLYGKNGAFALVGDALNTPRKC